MIDVIEKKEGGYRVVCAICGFTCDFGELCGWEANDIARGHNCEGIHVVEATKDVSRFQTELSAYRIAKWELKRVLVWRDEGKTWYAAFLEKLGKKCCCKRENL